MKSPKKIFIELRQQIFFLFQKPENPFLVQFTKLSSGFFHELVNPLVAISLHIDEIKNNNTKNLIDLEKRIAQAFEATISLESFVQKIKEQLGPPIPLQKFSVNEVVSEVLDILAFTQKKEQTKIVFLNSDKFLLFGNPREFYALTFSLLFLVLEIYHETPFSKRKPMSIKLTKNNTFLRVTIQAPDILIPKRKNNHSRLSLIKNTVKKKWKGKMKVLTNEKNGSKFDLDFSFEQ